MATLSINWPPPTFSNGDLTEYQVYIWTKLNNRDRTLVMQEGINVRNCCIKNMI